MEELDCATTPLARSPISLERAEQVAGLFKALADPVRLRLLGIVPSHENREACVCALTSAFDLTQPTISHHLRLLREASVVECQRRGSWVYYRAVPATLAALAEIITPPHTRTRAY